MSNNVKDSPAQAILQNGPTIYALRCRACGQCLWACPEGVLAKSKGRIVVEHAGLCNACLACEEACPEGAIEVSFAIVWGEARSQAPDQA